jgi:hypothetical protein
MCPHCNKPKPPPELLAQILSLQNNRTAQMMQGMDSQSPYMMNPMMGPGGIGGNFNGIGQNTSSTTGQNNSKAASGGYNDQNQNQNPQYNMGNGAQDNNSTNNNPYGMMNRGMSTGQSFDMNQFPGYMNNPMMGNMGFGGFPMNMQDMQRMGNYGNFGGNMNGGNQLSAHGQQEAKQNEGGSSSNQNMMDMNQMPGMGGYGFGQGGNQMMNFQNMTPEQQMQFMQYQRMNGGNMPNNMNPGGNQG